MCLLAQHKRIPKNSNDGFRIIIGRDAINGQSPAFHAFMDQHQLASLIETILVPAILHCQPDRFHLSLTGSQAVTRGE
jgi:hypothetical protein